MRTFFYDTWAFVALANTADPHHAVSVELDRSLEAHGFVGLTSDYVLDEAATLLHVSAGADVAISFLELIEAQRAGAELQLVEVSSDRRLRAIETFKKLAPTEPRLSFTDCTSFAVMRELKVSLAFTADRHFHRAGAGIRPLLELRGKRLSSLVSLD
jgi:predicted nucleic acid-binding protein